MNGLRFSARLCIFRCKFSHVSNNLEKRIPVLKESASYKCYSTENILNIPSNSDPKTSVIVDILQNAGVQSELITRALCSSSEIFGISPKQLEMCFDELQQNGFTADNCLKMATSYPPLLKLRRGHVSAAVEAWRSSQLGDSRILTLLRKCPHFMCMDLSQISRRLPLLRSLGSRKNIVELLGNVPNLMFDNWNDVMAKVDYIESVMKIDKKHIMNTYALNRSLTFLKTRHVLLVRCGLFKPPNPKADPNEPNKNPTLSAIADTSDDHFAEKVTGLTKEEYVVFQDLYEEELDDEDSDSDSDIDSE